MAFAWVPWLVAFAVTAAPEPLEDDEPAPSVAAPFERSEAPTSNVAPAPPEWKDGYVRVHPPRFRGNGLFAGAGIALAGTIAFQLGDIYGCGGCGGGFAERAFLGIMIGTATGGGIMRARHDAWYDTAHQRRRDARPFVIAGGVLIGVGGVLAAVNDAFWWGCFASYPGPYARADQWEWTDTDGTIHRRDFYECRYGVPQVLADTAGVILAAGGGLLGYGLMLKKRQAVFQRARVISWVPTVSRERVTLGIGGRF